MKLTYDPDTDIAIVGMAGRYPGAPDIEAFWERLCRGEDAATTFSDDELRAAGVGDPEFSDHHYVKRGLILEGSEDFDAAFFRYTPREAQVMNPELRLLLETAHHALDDAAIDPERTQSRIASFIGVLGSSYLLRHIVHNPAVIAQAGSKSIQLGNDANFSATHLAYRLNLRGPAMGLATGCSTTLVATHLARQSLLNYDCDVALVGGSHLAVNHGQGYRYQEGGIRARDGYCRPFDHRASGTISGSGVGAVVLKRLGDARADGSTIIAVIKSTAINNDGADKVGFTAPGLNGQSAVIGEALALADLPADAIGYHECHGTGTVLGDPIEIAALTQAHRLSGDKTGYCALGALKANFGHMAGTAGVAGLCKAALTLSRESIPPLIHFEQANPELRLSTTPFVVPTERRTWPRAEQPRYASVSAFGMGGTNAHAVLCEAPAQAETPTRRQWHLLPFSANDAQALEGQREALRRWGQDRSASTMADASQTLAQGRRRLGWRDYWVVGPEGQWHGGPAATAAEDLRMVWMFPGQGSQYPGMGRDLYASEPGYRQAMDECLVLLEDAIDHDLRHLLLHADAEDPVEQERLRETDVAQCALFCVSYAMARLWSAYGLRPTGMIGHSIGEYVAAAVAEVLPLPLVLGCVRQRAALMKNAPAGAMLSANAPLTEVEKELADLDTWDVAAVNTPDSCVLSADIDTIEMLEQRLQAAGIAAQRLYTSRAFHSRLMNGAASAFKPDVAEARRPRIVYVSNLDGQPVTEERLRDPAYWADHLRQTVRFADGVRTLAAQGPTVFLEVGPGQALTRMLGADRALDATAVIPSMRHVHGREPDQAVLLQAIGRLWTHGIELAAERRYEGEARRLISLPPYPFTRQRHALEVVETPASRPVQDKATTSGNLPEDWLYRPTWRRLPPLAAAPVAVHWVVVGGPGPLEASLRQALADAGMALTWLDTESGDYDSLAAQLQDADIDPDVLVYTTALDQPADSAASCLSDFLAFAQAFDRPISRAGIQLLSLTQGGYAVDGLGGNAVTSLLAAATKVCRQEHPKLQAALVDLPALAVTTTDWRALIHEQATGFPESLLLLRGGERWAQHFEHQPPVPLAAAEPLRAGGSYLITGGLGGMGLALGLFLARRQNDIHLLLLSRRRFPEREHWDDDNLSESEHDVVQRLRAIEALGARVTIVQGDVADREILTDVLHAAGRAGGSIRGVIHAAGLPGGAMMARLNAEDLNKVLRPKVDGLDALSAVLDFDALDFMVLCSSQNAIKAGVGRFDYAAANLYLDNRARQLMSQAPRTRVCSINWCAWSEVGMAAANEQHRHDSAEMISVTEAEAVFSLCLRSTGGQWIVSKRPFADVLAAREKTHLAEMDNRISAPVATGERPTHLSASYVPPEDDIQQQVVDIMTDVLGMTPIGIDDDFFELGGNSLLMIQVGVRMQKHYEIELSARDLFDKLTARQLAAYIQHAVQPAAGDDGHVDDLLKELETLSDADIDNVLADYVEGR